MITRSSPKQNCDLEILPPTSLYCHSAAITDIKICDNFRFFVSASLDGTAAIWDVDTLAYVRSLTGHSGGVSALAISRTSGDICTVCDSGESDESDDDSNLNLVLFSISPINNAFYRF